MTEKPINPDPGNDSGRVSDAVDNSWVDTFHMNGRNPTCGCPGLTGQLAHGCSPYLVGGVCFLPWRQTRRVPTWPTLGYLSHAGWGPFLCAGAGCTWNDIVDRDLDAKVARTRSRPLPSGHVSVEKATLWLIVQSVVAFAILLTMNSLATTLGLLSLILVGIYPFAKRFTWWPQIFLGLAFNWGVLLAWAAQSGTITAAALCLYSAGIAWTLFYDTIYAHQDKEDDALLGIKSTARLFADSTRLWLLAFIAISSTLMFTAVWLTLPPATFRSIFSPAFVGVAVFGFHLYRQFRNLNTSDSNSCLETFRSNKIAGLIVVVFFGFSAMF